MELAHFDIAPCPIGEMARLEDELGVSATLAQVLVRRGLTDPVAARAFLAGEEEHDPLEFSGMNQVLELILAHVHARRRITIHGDYDVDGVCSTAVLVRALRSIGADVDWYLPDRASDGYGLNPTTVQRLTERGTRLLITADCAITAVQEVAIARAAGLDVVVTDHHMPREDGALPDAPIVHPLVCSYPCLDLCATAVAYKLAQGLLREVGRDLAVLEEDLDLVALATIADVVPLRGENRTLVTRGLRILRGTAKPGLRALMNVARVDPSRMDERAVGFALAPRINAAGRLYRADASLELILTEDPLRAAQVAEELERANRERRHVETRVVFEAEAQVAELDRAEGDGKCAAYVLAGEGWHPGVIGIVASRLAERHRRPFVLIALEGESGRGSGRSIEAFDLLGGLSACGEHLLGYGGHRAAAGLEIERSRLEIFTEAFLAHARSALAGQDSSPHIRVDAVVPGNELGLELAEELERLEPFGHGNPPPSLLLPAAKLADVRAMGGEKHVRFTVHSGGAHLRGVAFGVGGRLPVGEEEVVDGVFTLEINEWNGVTEPRLKMRHVQPSDPAPARLVGERDAYMDAVWDELRLPLVGEGDSVGSEEISKSGSPMRKVHDRRGGGISGTITALVASGESVLVVCADACIRLGQLSNRIGGFSLCSYRALERDRSLSGDFAHLVLLDPPAHPDEHGAALMGDSDQHVHLLWGEAEIRFATRILERDHDLRPALSAVYRSLRKAGSLSGEQLEMVLRGARDTAVEGRPPVLAGALLRVLDELDLVKIDLGGGSVTIGAFERTNLERSATFRRHAEWLVAGRKLLSSPRSEAA